MGKWRNGSRDELKPRCSKERKGSTPFLPTNLMKDPIGTFPIVTQPAVKWAELNVRRYSWLERQYGSSKYLFDLESFL